MTAIANANSLSPRQVLVTWLEDLQEFGIQAGSLRENIVLRGLTQDVFALALVLKVGSKVSIRLTFHLRAL